MRIWHLPVPAYPVNLCWFHSARLSRAVQNERRSCISATNVSTLERRIRILSPALGLLTLFSNLSALGAGSLNGFTATAANDNRGTVGSPVQALSAQDVALQNASYVKLGTSKANDLSIAHDYWMEAMPLIGAPAGRSGHTAVWTGSEMIVWGGTVTAYPYSACWNDGGRYNPVANSWTAMTTNGAPAPRYIHTAVWTGSEMIIWGGTIEIGPIGFFGDGGRYNPAADSWTAMTTNGAPSPRAGHTAVWTGHEMVVWGGYKYGYSLFRERNDGARYDPSTDTWSPTAANGAPFARQGHTAVWTGREMIIWGGFNYDSLIYTTLNDGGRYNPSGDFWTAVTTNGAPLGGDGHTPLWTGTEMIVWGIRSYTIGSDGGRYNPASNSWRSVTTNGAPLAGGHTAVWTGNEMIVWGGEFEIGGSRYSPASDSWTPVTMTGAPPARQGHTAVWTGHKMVVWGGFNPANYGELNDGGRYNPTGSGTTYGIPDARAHHTAIWTGSEMIVWGGYDYDGLFPYVFNTGGRYNPVANTWIPVTTNGAPTARANHTAIWTGNEMIVWGGTGLSSNLTTTFLNDGGRYDPATFGWTSMTNDGAPTARKLHTAVWTGKEMIVWGGTPDGSSYVNDGGRYDPASNRWTSVNLVGVPGARAYHTAIWSGSEMIVWGGWNDSVLHDGGSFNPATASWTPVAAAAAPAGRFSHTAVWTGDEMIVWGGWNTSALNDGGRYNRAANRWTALTTTNMPAARAYHTAVWTGSEMVIWGGWNNITGFLDDGGDYNPAYDRWTAVPTNGAPAGRDGHTAVWTGSEMVVWGGTDGSYFNDIWSYSPSAEPFNPPALKISPAGGVITISWQNLAGGFILQQSHDLSTTNWITSGFPVNSNGSVSTVTITPAAGQLFFRLVSP